MISLRFSQVQQRDLWVGVVIVRVILEDFGVLLINTIFLEATFFGQLLILRNNDIFEIFAGTETRSLGGLATSNKSLGQVSCLVGPPGVGKIP
jgi:hypothetical protein